MKVLKREDRITATDARVLFVVHDEPEAIRDMMLAELEVPYPVLVDADRTAYDAWGLGRISWSKLWLDPNMWKQYASAMLGDGERIRGSGKDTRQLGGDFIVDRDGIVIYSRPQERDDRPAVGKLVEILESANGS